jgi:hypothetical protein
MINTECSAMQESLSSSSEETLCYVNDHVRQARDTCTTGTFDVILHQIILTRL